MTQAILKNVSFKGEDDSHVHFRVEDYNWVAVVTTSPSLFKRFKHLPGIELTEQTPIQVVFQLETRSVSLTNAALLFKDRFALKDPNFTFDFEGHNLAATYHEGVYHVRPFTYPSYEKLAKILALPNIQKAQQVPVNIGRNVWKLIIQPQNYDLDSVSMLLKLCIRMFIS